MLKKQFRLDFELVACLILSWDLRETKSLSEYCSKQNCCETHCYSNHNLELEVDETLVLKTNEEFRNEKSHHDHVRHKERVNSVICFTVIDHIST